MKDDVAIRVSELSKKYEIGKQKDGSLRGSLASIFSSSAKAKDEFWALKDVSFEVKKGEVIGIIGKNGAGKSTLLKVLSQITKPSSGKIEINGRVASLLEVGTGFHPELTGRENVYLNGTILGMTRKEVAAKFDEIVAFSGVEKFIDTPVKHYSSGMYVRLAFAVAAHLEPEILIIDEVLAVGDAEFQKKCLGKMKDVAGEGRTVLFVSHNMAAVRNLCDKGILIEKGEIIQYSNVIESISFYLKNSRGINIYLNENLDNLINCSILKIVPMNQNYQHSIEFANTEEIKLQITMKLNESIRGLKVGVALLNNMKNKIFTNHYEIVHNNKELLILDYTIPCNTLHSGNFSFDVALFSQGISPYEYLNDICHIKVVDTSNDMNQDEKSGEVKIKTIWNETYQ